MSENKAQCQTLIYYIICIFSVNMCCSLCKRRFKAFNSACHIYAEMRVPRARKRKRKRKEAKDGDERVCSHHSISLAFLCV